MKILMFFPGRVQELPPLVTAAACLASNGAQVRVLAFGAEGPSADYLRSLGVTLVCMSNRKPRTFFGKALLWLRTLGRFLREQVRMAPDCVWQHQSHFVAWHAFLPRLARRAVVVTHSHELTCHVWSRWFTQKILARRAHLVITPEVNRSLILQHLSRSDAQFFVVPNRPATPTLPQVPQKTSTADIFRQHGGSPQCTQFLIYQGAFMHTRCLEQVVQGFRKVTLPKVGLILIGGNPDSSMYRQLQAQSAGDSRIVILPHIPSPGHMQVTAGCVGGIVLYSPISLNNIYCAPNKIYEYALFGLGMVLPDYPGIAKLNQEFQFGSTCDPTDPDSIAQAMTTVLRGTHQQFQQACSNFLSAMDRPEDLFRRVSMVLEQMIEENRIRQPREIGAAG